MPYLNREAPNPEPIDCRILTAALDLFVENGYHNVSIHDVQKQANVSIGSIYNHFGGKEGVAKALYNHLLNEMTELVDSVLEGEASAKARSNRIIRLLFEYTESKRNIIAFVFHSKHREFIPTEPPICSSGPFKAMRNIVKEGIENGELRALDPLVAAASVFGSAIRMVHLRLDGILEEPLPSYYDDVIEGIWNGMDCPEVQQKKSKLSAL